MSKDPKDLTRDAESGAGENRSLRRTLFSTVAAVVLGLAGVDLAVRWLVVETRLPEQIVDIQTPTTLFTKIDYLRDFPGFKVALLGDSLVYGRTMSEHGDDRWREHTLNQALDEHWAVQQGEPALFLNLGMNGVLPMDLERLVEMVTDAGVDLIIFDVTLRSFSSDFASGETRTSRQWLHAMRIRPDGWLQSVGRTNRLDDAFASVMANVSFLYRVRDLLQWRLLNGEPRHAVERVQERLNEALQGSEASGSGLGGMLLQLRAKQRYAGINLDPGNPQLEALERVLARLAERQQPTVVFYATDSPAMLPGLTQVDAYEAMRDQLGERIRAAGPTIAYVGADRSADPEHFLDHVHVDARGYAALASRIWNAAEKVIGR